MNIGAILQSAIYLISSSMLYPAMALLVAGFATVVIGFGALISEWSARASSKKTNLGEMRPLLDFEAKYPGDALDKLGNILQKPDATWDDVENLWRCVRLESWKKLDYLRILARLAPAMGLVGTLIPMSTGLASLSQGDTSRLSSDLVVAFSTTVVGLCSGVAAYTLYTIKSRWLESDLQTLELVIESRATSALDGGERENTP
jgi:biopolymer transport protein ExbB/TolQ